MNVPNIVGRNQLSVLGDMLADMDYASISKFIQVANADGSLVITSGTLAFDINFGSNPIKNLVAALSPYMANKYASVKDVLAFGSWQLSLPSSGDAPVNSQVTYTWQYDALPLYKTGNLVCQSPNMTPISHILISNNIESSNQCVVVFNGLLIGIEV